MAILGRISLPAVICGVLLVMHTTASAGPNEVVRIGYVVSSNRTAQAEGAASLQYLMPEIQSWYADQMTRFGFAPKTFKIETQPDGVTPAVHVVSGGMDDATIRSNIWGNTLSAASDAGLPIWTQSQVWFIVPEAHQQQTDGSITGGTALGASWGSGSDAGVTMVGSNMLPFFSSTMLADTQAYAGQVIPQLGPYPLVQNVSFPWFEGSTFSSVSSSFHGAAAHELGHAFGLGHDFRNDRNFNGGLMGNGLRGWRGSLLPDAFPGDDVQLGYGAALALNTSRYFNPDAPVTDTTKPTVSVLTSGTVDPVNGQLKIDFTASDSGGLALALLRRGGELIGEMVLTHGTGTFLTPYYTPGESSDYAVDVYDEQGNRRSTTASITVNPGFNRAPVPFISLSSSIAQVGQDITLDASGSSDSDNGMALLSFEWDLNGDGVFEIGSSSDPALVTNFQAIGDWLVYARITDPAGAVSVSAPLSLRIVPEPATLTLLTLGGLAILRRRRKR
jgi:hypothetical protein